MTLKKSPECYVRRRHELHAEKMRRIMELKARTVDPRSPRYPLHMKRKRDMERSVRIDALAFRRWLLSQDRTPQEAAHRLRVLPNLLAAWERCWRKDRMRPRQLLGRPRDDLPYETRMILMAIFNLVGPGIGLDTLRGMLPDMPRNAAERYLNRYRQLHLRKNKVVLHMLRWYRPGTVWAADLYEPTKPVDRQYPFVLAVRDLASGYLLLAQPLPDKSGPRVRDALLGLVRAYGAPLVLKTDWGFRCEPLEQLMKQEGIEHLLSPPGWPRYNGSIEAGIGSMQGRAHLHAARHGHPGEWNGDDVEAARCQANETARPWGHREDTPQQAWEKREPVGPLTRHSFRQAVRKLEPEAQEELGYLSGIPLAPKDQASVSRVAISRVLVAQGFLRVRRGRFTLPINPRIRSIF